MSARHYGRRNATLTWLSGFQAQAGDATDYGYRLAWYVGHGKSPAGSVELKHASLAQGFASDDYHVHDLSHTLPVSMCRLVSQPWRQVSPVRALRLQEGTLLPNTSYVFRVNLFYGEVRRALRGCCVVMGLRDAPLAHSPAPDRRWRRRVRRASRW